MKRTIYRTLQRIVQGTYYSLSLVFGILVVLWMENDLQVPTWLAVSYIITTSLSIGKLIYLDYKKGE